jgi:glyoxylase-like metal-dependent hydrolase (beta-lactamase superfamily II)
VTLGAARAAKRVILIDSGLGPAMHDVLMAGLAEAGVDPDEVTDALVTRVAY